jgi:phosphate uptake regulator
MEAAIDMTLLGRYYERFGDHAVSVSRRVVYLVTGEVTGQAGEAAAVAGVSGA